MTITAVIVVMIAQTSFGTLFTVLVGNSTRTAFLCHQLKTDVFK